MNEYVIALISQWRGEAEQNIKEARDNISSEWAREEFGARASELRGCASDLERALAAPTPAADDAKRLDWLLDHSAIVRTDGRQWRVEYDWLPPGASFGPWAETKRAAIDAAIANERGE